MISPAAPKTNSPRSAGSGTLVPPVDPPVPGSPEVDPPPPDDEPVDVEPPDEPPPDDPPPDEPPDDGPPEVEPPELELVDVDPNGVRSGLSVGAGSETSGVFVAEPSSPDIGSVVTGSSVVASFVVPWSLLSSTWSANAGAFMVSAKAAADIRKRLVFTPILKSSRRLLRPVAHKRQRLCNMLARRSLAPNSGRDGG